MSKISNNKCSGEESSFLSTVANITTAKFKRTVQTNAASKLNLSIGVVSCELKHRIYGLLHFRIRKIHLLTSNLCFKVTGNPNFHRNVVKSTIFIFQMKWCKSHEVCKKKKQPRRYSRKVQTLKKWLECSLKKMYVITVCCSRLGCAIFVCDGWLGPEIIQWIDLALLTLQLSLILCFFFYFFHRSVSNPGSRWCVSLLFVCVWLLCHPWFVYLTFDIAPSAQFPAAFIIDSLIQMETILQWISHKTLFTLYQSYEERHMLAGVSGC